MTRECYGDAYQQGFEATFRFLRAHGLPWERANEVAQAAWAKGWERLDQLSNDGMVVAWVNSIALNVNNRLLRNDPVWQSLREMEPAVSVPFPGVNLAAIDMDRILRVCGPGDRALLQQQLSGDTPAEIARQRGVPETAIRVRLLRARRTARMRIEQMHRGN